MGYDAWLEEPIQREYAEAARAEAMMTRRYDGVHGTDCGCHRDEGDRECRLASPCDECKRAAEHAEAFATWDDAWEDYAAGDPDPVMPPVIAQYFAERDERRADSESEPGEDFREPDADDCERSWCREP